MKEALATAAERRAEVVILRLNTPGGLVTSMREIIADVLASPVPVVGYVAPSGAHAASAGTYILYATHVAAMAPGTNLGAATPVEIGAPIPGLPAQPDHDKGDKGGGNEGDRQRRQDAMTAKMTNDAVAFIRSLAELRGRNADWAEKAVREAASLSANAALQAGVIDLVAGDTTELLAKIDGRTVAVAGGVSRPLATRGLTVETLEPGWLIRLLSVITDPNVAVIMLLVGVYGLIFEFTSPGAVAPGVIGTIALLLGLYALNLLPIDYAGLALMLLGTDLPDHRGLQPDRYTRPRRPRRVPARHGDAYSRLRRPASTCLRPSSVSPPCWSSHLSSSSAACSGAPAAGRRASARGRCTACRPRSSIGGLGQATCALMANAGRPAATEPSPPARRSKSRPSMASL